MCKNTEPVSVNTFKDEQFGHSLLVLGDGNLSFSLALAKLHRDAKIVATVYEDEPSWLAKYGLNGASTIECLKNCGQFPNISVLFGIDATNVNLLKKQFNGTTFTDIIFNFPHHGGKTNLRKSRAFLRQIFGAIVPTFMDSAGSPCNFHLTMAHGQSGLLESEAISSQIYFSPNRPNHKRDSWQPLEIAAEFGLTAKSIKCFCASNFPGYVASGYKSRNQHFNNRGNAHAITFMRCPIKKLENIQLSADLKAMEMATLPRRDPQLVFFSPVYHLFRPLIEYDISILFPPNPSLDDDDNDNTNKLEQDLLGFLHQTAHPFLVNVFELPAMRCVTPRGVPNRIYRIHLQGIGLPLHRTLANAMNDQLCVILKEKLAEHNRGLDIVTIPSYLVNKHRKKC